jgi:hypothetical protein
VIDIEVYCGDVFCVCLCVCGRQGWVVCTQPRVIAALTLAKRIADEVRSLPRVDMSSNVNRTLSCVRVSQLCVVSDGVFQSFNKQYDGLSLGHSVGVIAGGKRITGSLRGHCFESVYLVVQVSDCKDEKRTMVLQAVLVIHMILSLVPCTWFDDAWLPRTSTNAPPTRRQQEDHAHDGRGIVAHAARRSHTESSQHVDD